MSFDFAQLLFYLSLATLAEEPTLMDTDITDTFGLSSNKSFNLKTVSNVFRPNILRLYMLRQIRIKFLFD